MRGKTAPKRIISPDPIYNSILLQRFINRVMKSGKKTVAQNLIYKAFDQIKETTKENPLSVFEKAITTVEPRMEVRPRRVGGASYQVPTEVRGNRRQTLAIRWIIEAAQSKSNKEFHSFDKKLAEELINASRGDGIAFKKKEDIQKQAAANRAFAHFRW